MGNNDAPENRDWLRHAIMTLVSPGARLERASNHTNFVVEQIGRAIVAGEYPAESMIPLDPDLCEMFDVSRTVVREAKKTLAAKGLIQSKAKVGTHVRPAVEWNLFDEDVLRWHTSMKNPGRFYEELLEIRLIFEPAAASQAARRANDAECTHLFGLCDALADARSRADFVVADYEFHQQVLSLSDNRFLQSLGHIVQTALYSLFLKEAEASFLDARAEVAGNHRLIAKAICNGQPAEAHDAMAHVIREGHLRAAG